MATQDKKRKMRDVLGEEEIDRLEGLLPSGALEEALEGLEPGRSPARVGC